ncbi:MAG: CDP-glycerol glycerophosphotransferase family protein [Lachnospiraceae bacterium]|nr:CDP-glycerol glycerophosphotransferase family protein [Lachnospiraceae bacterium]
MLAYIDPGTGSMLFSILIGIFAAVVFFFQKLIIKVKFLLSGGRADRAAAMNAEKIPFLIFSESGRYWNTFKPVCDEFEKRGVDITYWTASEEDPALKEKYEHVKTEFIGEGNKAFTRLNLANADVLLATTPGLDVYQWKRSKNVGFYAHVLHAAGDPVMYRMFGLDFYDAVFIAGDFMKDELLELWKRREIKPRELPMAGIPYLDAMKERLEKEGASDTSDKKNRSVLVAPAWGPDGLLTVMGEEILGALKDTGYDITVRPHPQSFTAEKELMERLMKKFPENEHFHWNRDRDNFECLKSSDIMISDFSGVIYDYTLVFDKPLIYTDTGASYNKVVYDCCWLDEEPWMIRKLPEIGTPLKKDDIGNIKKVIDSAIESSEFSEARKKARTETWKHPGIGAELIADNMISWQEELESKRSEEGKK